MALTTLFASMLMSVAIGSWLIRSALFARNARRSVVTSLVILVLAAGCQSSNPSADSEGGSSIPDSGSSETATQSSIHPSDETTGREDLVRDYYLSGDHRDFYSVEVLARHAEIEGACMRQQGFEYVDYWIEPPPEASLLLDLYGVELDPALVAEQGYGIYVNLEQVRLEDRLRGLGLEDPNVRIRASLTVEERLEYDIARWGFPQPPTADELADLPSDVEVDEAGVPLDWAQDIAVDESGGCSGKADREIGAPALEESEQEILQDIDARTKADPSVVEAERQWTACMAAQGFDVDGLQGIVSELDDLLMRAVENSVVVEEEFETAGETVVVPVERFDPEAMADLIDQEILLASADSDCRIESDLTAIWNEAQLRVTRDALDEAFQR